MMVMVDKSLMNHDLVGFWFWAWKVGVIDL